MRCPSLASVTALMTLCLSAAAQTQEAHFSSLSRMSGCWAAESDEPGSGEHWLLPAGGTLLGVAKTVKNGRTVAHEFLQIRLNTEGKIVYLAQPSGQKEATFAATSVSETAVTFANPQHDLPQHITCRMPPGDRLAARIEGQRGGALRGFEFPMKRVPCEALAGE